MKLWSYRYLQRDDAFFRVVSTTRASQLAIMTLKPGEASGEFGNEHPGSDQWLYVIEGAGEVVSDSGASSIGPGDLILVQAGDGHQFRCTGSTVLRSISIYAPPAYSEDETEQSQ